MTVTDAAAKPPGPYAQAVAPLLNNGWWPVPLNPGTKYPPPVGYTGNMGTQPTTDNLVDWATTRPDSNVAVRLPLDVVGIDVDAYDNKHGDVTLEALEERAGALPPTAVVTSRTDGHSGIRLFRLPDGADQTTFRTGWAGIEILRYGHRYVVAPPSMHPLGHPYRCFHQATGENLDTIPPATDLPYLPDAWLPELVKPVPPPRPHGTSATTGVGRDGMCRSTTSALDTALDNLSRGTSRHDDVTKSVLALVRLDEQGHEGGLRALDELHAAFLLDVTSDGSRGTSLAQGEWDRLRDGADVVVARTPTSPFDKGCCGTPDSVDLAALVTPPRVELQPVPDEPTDTPEEAPRTTWWPRDLTGVLSGDIVEMPPTYLTRDDGAPLLYPGRINGLLGESESGKTWIALLAVTQVLASGLAVLYIDFEDTAAGIVSRLRAMGATDTDLERLTYLDPTENLHLAAAGDLAETLDTTQAALIVIDGINAAMTVMGLEINDNTDATKFAQKLLRPLARTGAAALTVDHVPKAADQRGKGGIGAQAKRAMTDGCAIACDVVQPFGRGMTGKLRLTVDKDRPGYVRAVSSGARYAGTAVLDSDIDTGNVTVTIHAPDLRPIGEREPWRPTGIMERVSNLLQGIPEGVSGKVIETEVQGKAEHIRIAVTCLHDEGHLDRIPGPRGAMLHVLVKPYREIDDIAPNNELDPPEIATDRRYGDLS